MRAIAVTKLSERRTKVVCGSKTYYVRQVVAEAEYEVDDGEESRRIEAPDPERAVTYFLIAGSAP